ncbi:hypothetical protein KAU45_00590 [bacterium]|nr:hypothetical protein [bacterium]
MTRIVTLLLILLATFALALGDRVGEGEIKVNLPSPDWEYEDYGNEIHAWWPNPDDPDLDFGTLSLYSFQLSPVSEDQGRADLEKTLTALADLLDEHIQDNYLVVEMGMSIRVTEPYLMVGRYYTDEGFGWEEESEEPQRFFNLDALYLHSDYIFAANLYVVEEKADEIEGGMEEVLTGVELPEWEAQRYTDGDVVSLGGFTLTVGDGPWIAVEDFGGVTLTAYDGFDEMANLMMYRVDEPDPTGEKTAEQLMGELREFLDSYFTGFEVEYVGDGFAREGQTPYAAWAYHVDLGLGDEYHYDAQLILEGESYYLEAVVGVEYEDRMAPVLEKMAEGTVIEPGAGSFEDYWDFMEDFDDAPEPDDGE